MKFEVIWEGEAINELSKFQKDIALKIYTRITEHLSQEPLKLGKALTGSFKGLYRYRYGDYRVIYEVSLNQKTITVNRISHRKNAYL